MQEKPEIIYQINKKELENLKISLEKTKIHRTGGLILITTSLIAEVISVISCLPNLKISASIMGIGSSLYTILVQAYIFSISKSKNLLEDECHEYEEKTKGKKLWEKIYLKK